MAEAKITGNEIKDNSIPQSKLSFAIASNVNLFENAIINGNFDVWQRGTSFTNPNSKITSRSADRWNTFRNGWASNITTTRQSAGLAGSRYCMRVQRNNGDTSTALVQADYVLETQDSVPFQGQLVTVSFQARKGANYSGGNLTLDIVTGKGTDQHTLDPMTTQATLKTLACALTTSWQKFTVTIDSALATDITQLALRLYYTPSGTAGAADYVEITQVKMEKGSSATDYCPPRPTNEFDRCLRYYNITKLGLGYWVVNDIGPYGYGFCYANFPTVMRAVPTMTNLVWENSGTDTTNGGITDITTQYYKMYGTSAGNSIYWAAQNKADAEL